MGRLFHRVAVRASPLRFVSLCDSQVARCAVSKGRSPSKGLRHVTRRTSSLCLAAGIYPGTLFCWIPANGAPRPIDPSVCTLGPAFWDKERIRRDTQRARLKRWAANWVRLAFAVSSGLADLPLEVTESRCLSVPLPVWISMPRLAILERALGSLLDFSSVSP